MSRRYALPPLKWLMAFEASARHLSFTAAADELGLTQAAVSYQIRMLETQLGFPLFERRPRQLRLTDMGHAYLPAVRRAFDSLLSSTAALFGQMGQRPVTIRVAISFAVLCLAPRLEEFRTLYPGVKLRVWSSIWANATEPAQADFDIRFGDGKWSGYESTRLADEEAVLVCSPALPTPPRSTEDVARIPASRRISIAGQEELWERASGGGEPGPPAVGDCNVDTSLAAAELAATGFGYAVLLRRFAAPFLASGRLVAPTGVRLPMTRAHHLLMPLGKERPRPEVLLLRDWLLGCDWTVHDAAPPRQAAR